MKDHRQDFTKLGLIIVGDCKSIDGAASPSTSMLFLSKEAIKKIAIRVRDLILRIDLQTPLERRGAINALQDSKEFTITAVWSDFTNQKLDISR
jgi:hypothetical protein